MTTELEKQRREAIALFLNVTGPPNERFFLWWDGRDSFFDEDVQEVLKARRPTDATKAPWEQLDYPIQAWSDADTFRLVNSEKTFDLGNIKAWMCGPDSTWFLMLMVVLDAYQKKHEEAMRNPKRALDNVMWWRTERYLRETSRLAHSKADATRINAQIRQIRAEAEKHPDPLLGAAPLFVSARLESPSKYLDAFEGGRPLADIEGGAARKAVHDENKHRKKIMGEWAPCWLAHLRQWPMEESQQSASGKGIKTTRARKQRSQDCYQKPPKK